MNYLAARKRCSDERWDYTCRNDKRIWPVGYCAGWYDWTPADSASLGHTPPPEWHAARKVYRDKYHEDGHATPEEACRCYREYLLDNELRLDRQWESLYKCAECGEWTDRFASVGGRPSVSLCDAHRTREVVEKHFPTVGESMES